MDSTAAHHINIPYLFEALAFLLTVVIIVPVFRRIKISPILGYLGVGAIIGPYGASVIKDASSVQHFAELGVIILLFTIGLELSFRRLRSFASLIFGLGAAQVLLTGALIAAMAFAWGNSIEASIILGLCLALSSTAMVMQLLYERNEIGAVHGRASFAVLLFQDLAVVPILILLSVFGGDQGTSVWWSIASAFIKAAITIGLIILVGRYALSFVFRSIARLHNVDVFTALILLSVLATSAITGMAGLSMALGAFLAGLLLAETEFRHQIEGDIEPFKGLFLGLFFMGVGMNIDFAVAFERGVWVVLSVAGLLLLKGAVATLLARLFGLKWPDAVRSGMLLAESGEFAFVVIGQASLSYDLIPKDVGQFMVVVAGLSMIFTPFLASLGSVVHRRMSRDEPQETLSESGEEAHDHVVIAGFGRVGRAVASVLTEQSISYIALDTSADEVRQQREHYDGVFVGDASRPEILRRSGIGRASTLLVTMDNPVAAKQTVAAARQEFPDLKIVVRSRDRRHAEELLAAGADQVVPETLEASLQLSAHVLHATGISREEAAACVEAIRRADYSRMHL